MEADSLLTVDGEQATCKGSCSACSSVGSCAGRTVCRCLKVTEDAVIEAIRTGGAETIRELKYLCGAGDGCMSCHGQLKRYLEIYSPSSSPSMC